MFIEAETLCAHVPLSGTILMYTKLHNDAYASHLRMHNTPGNSQMYSYTINTVLAHTVDVHIQYKFYDSIFRTFTKASLEVFLILSMTSLIS